MYNSQTHKQYQKVYRVEIWNPVSWVTVDKNNIIETTQIIFVYVMIRQYIWKLWKFQMAVFKDKTISATTNYNLRFQINI